MSSVKESDEVVSHEDQPETDSQVSKSLTDKKNAVLESYESLTVSDNEACNLPSQKEALICSSPKKRKRLRDPSRILSPKHQQEDEEIEMLLKAVPPIQENFNILSKVGEGTFSSVFLAQLKGVEKTKFALKHIIPTSSPCRVENELRCLQVMGGSSNIISLETCLRHRDHVVFVLPYIEHDRFIDYLPHMDVKETRIYMKSLLTALRHVHSFHIIHRDVKPSNFLYNRRKRSYYLVDFGLAHLESGRSGENSILHNSITKPSTNSASQKGDEVRRSPRFVENSKTPSSNPSQIQKSTQSSVIHPTGHEKHSLTSTTPVTNMATVSTATATMVTINRERGCDECSPPLLEGEIKSPKSKRVKVFQNNTSSKRKNITELKRFSLPCNQRSYKVALSGLRPKRRSSGSRQGEVKQACSPQHKNTEICEICMGRSGQNAPRAGTPGFRAPEVLLKHPYQTTAVDNWAVGVILLCILSGRYPFFRAQDDLTALSQIVSLFGSSICKAAAVKLGKELLCKPDLQQTDLKVLCFKLRSTVGHNGDEPSSKTASKSPEEAKHTNSKSLIAEGYSESEDPLPSDSGFRITNDSLLSPPNSVFDLLYRLLDLDPNTRISASDALKHPFIFQND